MVNISKKLLLFLISISWCMPVHSYNPEDVSKVVAYSELLQTHVPAGLSAAQRDLSNLNLRNAVFKDLDLSCANMCGTDARGATFIRCTFLGTNVRRCDFSSPRVTRTSRRRHTYFSCCTFEEVATQESFWDQVIFKRCDIRDDSFVNIASGRTVLFVRSGSFVELPQLSVPGCMAYVNLLFELFSNQRSVRRHVLLNDNAQIPDSVVINDQRCSICLGDYEDNAEVAVTPCGHVFCYDCLHVAVQENARCPNCRNTGVVVRQAGSGGIKVGGCRKMLWKDVASLQPLPRLRPRRQV